MAVNAVTHLIVLIRESKFRVIFSSDGVRLRDVVDDALADYLTYHEGIDEVSLLSIPS